MKKADILYKDCVEFWKRMGIENQYNAECLATFDLSFSKCDGYEVYMDKDKLANGKDLCKIISDKKYDTNRGRVDWLKGKGF